MKAEPQEIRHLRNKLSISRDNYLDNIDYQSNENNQVTHLHLYDAEGFWFPNLNGDLSFLLDFDHLTSIEIDIDQELDYSTIGRIKNLESLNVSANSHSINFNQLSNLNLKYLYVAENLPIENLDFVKGMSELESLAIYGNGITDLEALRNLKNLTEVFISGSSITDISPIENLENLQNLAISGKIKNPEILSNFKNLHSLSLINCDIQNCSFLKNLNSIKYLHLSNNRINSLDFIENLPNIFNLNLSNNELIEIGKLEHLENLVYLNLDKNQIQKIESLSKLRNLNQLSLNENQIEDIAPLSTLNNLKYLSVSNNLITEISAVPRFCYDINVDNNPVEKISITNTIELKRLTVMNHKISSVKYLILPTSLEQLNLANKSDSYLNRFYRNSNSAFYSEEIKNTLSLSFEDLYKDLAAYYFYEKDYENAEIYFKLIKNDLQFVRNLKFEKSLIEYYEIGKQNEKLDKLWEIISTYISQKHHQSSERSQRQADELFKIIANETFKYSDKERLIQKLNPSPIIQKTNSENNVSIFEQAFIVMVTIGFIVAFLGLLITVFRMI